MSSVIFGKWSGLTWGYFLWYNYTIFTEMAQWMNIQIPELEFTRRKENGLTLFDLLVYGWCIGNTAEAISKRLKCSLVKVDESVSRLSSVGKIQRRVDGTLLKNSDVSDSTPGAQKYKSFISVDEDETEFLKEVAADTLFDPMPSRLLSYWKYLFEHSIGRVCTETTSAKTYGQLRKVIDALRTPADVMIIMEYVVDMRVRNEPLWDGAEVRDPSLGLLCGSQRLSSFMEAISKDDNWMKRRALYNYLQCGKKMERLRRIFPAAEFKQLEKYIP